MFGLSVFHLYLHHFRRPDHMYAPDDYYDDSYDADYEADYSQYYDKNHNQHVQHNSGNFGYQNGNMPYGQNYNNSQQMINWVILFSFLNNL